jgi:hypothetical protein
MEEIADFNFLDRVNDEKDTLTSLVCSARLLGLAVVLVEDVDAGDRELVLADIVPCFCCYMKYQHIH